MILQGILDADAAAFLDPFGESVVYTPDPDSGQPPVTVQAVVIRRAPGPVREGQRGGASETLSAIVEIQIANNASTGVATITPGRDQITVAQRYGGPAVPRLVTMVDPRSNAGMWYLRVK